RRRRQTRAKNMLAVADAVANRGLQLFELGAALPAGLEMTADVAGGAGGEFAIQIAEQLQIVEMLHMLLAFCLAQAHHSAAEELADGRCADAKRRPDFGIAQPFHTQKETAALLFGKIFDGAMEAQSALAAEKFGFGIRLGG